jgi:hypothetical protein
MKKLVLLALLVTTGCVTSSAVPLGSRLDKNSANECRAHCDALEMSLDAVVVILNSTGCVCTPRDRPAAAAGGPSAAAGAAAIQAIAAAHAQQSTPSK